MTLKRQDFPSRLADLGFSMEVPDGFHQPEFPQESHDFDNPTVSAPLALLVSPIATAVVSVAARPAYADGSVMDWARFLIEHFQMQITSLMPGAIGGASRRHPAILLSAAQVQEGTALQFRIAVLEDGGRLLTITAMCPEELVAAYLPRLEQCVNSLELASPKGPTAPLVPGGPIPQLQTLAKV